MRLCFVISCAAEILNIFLPDLFDGTSFKACNPGESVALPTFAKPKESGTDFDAKKSTARPEAIRALITNGAIYAYADDLRQVYRVANGRLFLCTSHQRS